MRDVAEGLASDRAVDDLGYLVLGVLARLASDQARRCRQHDAGGAQQMLGVVAGHIPMDGLEEADDLRAEHLAVEFVGGFGACRRAARGYFTHGHLEGGDKWGRGGPGGGWGAFF